MTSEAVANLKKIDMISQDKFPSRKEHPCAGDTFVPISSVSELLSEKPDKDTLDSSSTHSGAKKLFTEVSELESGD